MCDDERTADDAALQPALRVCGLAYRYAAIEVFADVSFVLDQGSIAFLVGPNGAGKSTLFRCLAGWAPLHVGTIELFGERFDGSNRSQRRMVAYVPDVPTFYDDLTAEEHILFLQRANGIARGRGDADALMEAFGLASHKNRYPSTYSRGMKQKLALVIALAARPRLLLLDEPYGPLDPDAAEVLSGLLGETRSAGMSALVSCHHDVAGIEPDRLLRLEDGWLHEQGPGCSFGAGLKRPSAGEQPCSQSSGSAGFSLDPSDGRASETPGASFLGRG